MIEDTPAVIVRNVSKSFKVPLDKASGIKQHIVNFFSRRKGYREFKALDDLSFEIKKGEFFGIVGKNGSGKSTLLKTLAGIYTPGSGHIQVNGSLTPFIELGVGFNPELSGRENVFLNGALLGFGKKEMETMYEEIVDFAELPDFMEERLKNYSSGMQVRLAFSIAIRAQSDILLLDEVLAVGDEAFQKKCINYFHTVKKSKQTVILVTHDMGNIERFCDRVLVLDKGKQLSISEPETSAMMYEQLNRNDEVQNKDFTLEKRWGSSEVKFKDVRIRGSKRKRLIVEHGEPLEIEFVLESAARPLPVIIGLAISDEDGTNMSGPNSEQHHFLSNDTIVYKIPTNPLNPGTYRIRAALYDGTHQHEYDHIEDAIEFDVLSLGKKELHGKIDLFGEWAAEPHKGVKNT